MHLEPTAKSPFSRQTEHHTDCAGNVIVWVQLPSEILNERMSLLNALLAANSTTFSIIIGYIHIKQI